jgi:uncharacterized lipoprotein
VRRDLRRRFVEKERNTMGKHPHSSRRFLAVGALCLMIAPLLSGCPVALLGAGAAAGVGAYKYVEGEASQVHAGSYDQVWNGSLNALRQMNMTVVDTKRDALGGEIKARRAADNKDVTVKVEPVDRDSTRVKVRVGTIGDEEESRLIHQRISTALARR